ncbi:DUF4304 domain-containing protein [Morganella morganii]|nr:DUF4304 domain-containing protein [Morganella morganii]
MTTDSRKSMEKALKEIFVLDLKSIGFKGSFPHFRRITDNSIDLLTFQFYSSGGSFVIEIAQCSAEGFRNASGALTPPDKVQVKHVWPRLRLGAKPDEGVNDHWFKFGEPNYEPQKNYPSEHYKAIAETAVCYLSSQAENWWAHNKSKHSDGASAASV